jgi:hypothetical protein
MCVPILTTVIVFNVDSGVPQRHYRESSLRHRVESRLRRYLGSCRWLRHSHHHSWPSLLHVVLSTCLPRDSASVTRGQPGVRHLSRVTSSQGAPAEGLGRLVSLEAHGCQPRGCTGSHYPRELDLRILASRDMLRSLHLGVVLAEAKFAGGTGPDPLPS